MSSNDDLPLDSESGRDEEREIRRSNSSSQRPANIIEFVNSDDPNVRSTIQRHTAYHSAAQRRDARSRLLRRSSQSRYLEWGRRLPRTDTDTTTSSTSSASISPVRSMGTPQPSRPSSNPTDQGSETSQSRTTSIIEIDSSLLLPPVPPVLQDNPIIEFFTNTICHHNRSTGLLDPAINYMLDHEASRHLLLAYAYAMRWKLHASPETIQDQVDAQSHLSMGTNALRNRLRLSGPHTSSDSVIQAVLLLLVYTADFGQPGEVRLHEDALRTMLAQRGGIDAFAHNPTLQAQLWTIESSRAFHLTFGCEVACSSPFRFAGGLGLRPAAATAAASDT